MVNSTILEEKNQISVLYLVILLRNDSDAKYLSQIEYGRWRYTEFKDITIF